MALTGWSDNTNYLSRSSPVWPGAVGFYVSAWCYRATGSAASGWIWSLHETDAHRSMYAFSNDAITLEVSGVVGGEVTGAHANATWFHAGVMFNSTAQALYRDAATPFGSSETDAITAPTATKIGVHGPGGNSEHWATAGALAEISVWNTSGMSGANVTSLDAKLFAGQNPITINAESSQPWTGKLVAYWPLTNTSDLGDASGNGHTLTMQGTLTNFGSHPTIDPTGPTPKTFTGTSNLNG